MLDFLIAYWIRWEINNTLLNGCWQMHKGQLISKGLFGFFNSSKKRTKIFCPSRLGQKLKLLGSFFGRIEETKMSFQNWLTFKGQIIPDSYFMRWFLSKSAIVTWEKLAQNWPPTQLELRTVTAISTSAASARLSGLP